MGGGTLMRKSPFDTWAQWRRKQAESEPGPVWESCGYCWGQGRIVEEPSGDVYLCPRCIGVCQVPAA